MKIRPVGDVLFQADGRKDGWSDIQKDKHMTKLMVAFHNFVHNPKKKTAGSAVQLFRTFCHARTPR